MCLIAFALHASSRWPLVIAANRDEFLDRPTVPLARWKTSQGHDVISGRDLRAGGAWFGITQGGRVAFLTNVRGADALPAPRSRGELVLRWLESQTGTDDFLTSVAADPMAFAGFNLVFGDFGRSQWHWVTNRPAATRHQNSKSAWHHEALKPGIYGLSNAALDTPWPKTTQLKGVLGQSLHARETAGDLDALQADLWQALGNRERASAADLPATGIPQAREEALSSAFVEMPEYAYGTRGSTLLAVASSQTGWDVTMEEREYLRHSALTGSAAKPDWQQRRETLRWPAETVARLSTVV